MNIIHTQLFRPLPHIEPMIDPSKPDNARTPTTPARLGHIMNKENLLETGMEEGHGAHDTWFVRGEEREVGEEIRLAVSRWGFRRVWVWVIV